MHAPLAADASTTTAASSVQPLSLSTPSPALSKSTDVPSVLDQDRRDAGTTSSKAREAAAPPTSAKRSAADAGSTGGRGSRSSPRAKISASTAKRARGGTMREGASKGKGGA